MKIAAFSASPTGWALPQFPLVLGVVFVLLLPPQFLLLAALCAARLLVIDLVLLFPRQLWMLSIGGFFFFATPLWADTYRKSIVAPLTSILTISSRVLLSRYRPVNSC